MTDTVKFMEQATALDYRVLISPVQRRFDELMVKGRITGHKCPSCGLVYVPPKGYCPLCVVATDEQHEVDIADRGTVTSFTVLTPIQYHGQKEKKPYALASLLLDGADSTVGQQRIAGIPLEEVRTGIRVKAAWLPEAERRGDATTMGRWNLGHAIEHWEPTGEPDVPLEQFQEHVL